MKEEKHLPVIGVGPIIVIPVLCWIYMTILLIHTEEKWLRGMYGPEYEAYCKKVNRCIPWFPK